MDGEVLERNIGEKPHARLQSFFVRCFAPFEEEGNFETLTEQRGKITARRYRVPDVALVELNVDEPLIVASTPLLCIEILSSEDRLRKLEERLRDYASIGVRSMWVIDPWRGTASSAGPDGTLSEVKDRLEVAGTRISISVAQIFAELERRAKGLR